MNRFFAAVLALAALTIVPAAEAAPKRVTSTVTLTTSTLTFKLAPGSKLKSVRGGTAKTKRRMVTITARGRTLTIVTTGAAPKAWTAGGKPCLVKRAGKKRTVTCLGQGVAGGVPGGGAPGPGAMPGGGSPVSNPSARGAAYKWAPYVDFSGWPVPQLAQIRTESGTRHISLGFVTQTNVGLACTPTWGGFDVYPATDAGAYQLQQVKDFKAAGGDVIASFGGAAGTELANSCGDAATLADAYEKVVKAYGFTQVDFDIEGPALTNQDINVRRNQAIAELQRRNPSLVVTFTLPSLITGLDDLGYKLVENAVASGVEIAAVNIMAMNLNVADPNGMGTHAITAATALYGQIGTLFPQRTEAQRWATVGVTPMAGVNDIPSQNFTPQDAAQLLAWAKQKQIGMLGLWSLQRDEQRANKYEYAKVFTAFE